MSAQTPSNVTTKAADEESATEIELVAGRLHIDSPDALNNFWKAILPDFLEMVDPKNCGFLEDLYAGEVLTGTDYESLVSGTDTVPRKQKARKLWLILSSHSLDVFTSHVAPKLCERYALMIPGTFFTTSDQCLTRKDTTVTCLRHVIQSRVRLETMADLLMHNGCLPHSVYREIITEAAQKPGDKWSLLFRTFAESSPDIHSALHEELKDLFRRYKIPCPDNVIHMLSCGFPCHCKQPEEALPRAEINTQEQVQAWLKTSVTTKGSLYSSESSLTRVDLSTGGSTPSLIPASEVDNSRSGASETPRSGSSKLNNGVKIPDNTIGVSFSDVNHDAKDGGHEDETSARESDDEGIHDDALAEKARVLLQQPSVSADTKSRVAVKMEAFVEYYEDSCCSVCRKERQLWTDNIKMRVQKLNHAVQNLQCCRSKCCHRQLLKLVWRLSMLALFLSFIFMIMLRGWRIPSAGLELFWAYVAAIVIILAFLTVLLLFVLALIFCGKILVGMAASSLAMFVKALWQTVSLKAKQTGQNTTTQEIELQEV